MSIQTELNQDTDIYESHISTVAFANKLIDESVRNCILYYILKNEYTNNAIQCLPKDIKGKNKAINILIENGLKHHANIVARAFINRKEAIDDYNWIFTGNVGDITFEDCCEIKDTEPKFIQKTLRSLSEYTIDELAIVYENYINLGGYFSLNYRLYNFLK